MAFILSGIAYGILEVFLLHILLKSALSGDLKKSILPLFIKLMSYGAALLLIYFFFSVFLSTSFGRFLITPLK